MQDTFTAATVAARGKSNAGQDHAGHPWSCTAHRDTAPFATEKELAKMKLKVTAIGFVVLAVTACQPQPASRAPVAGVSPSLPLTSEMRRELAAELAQVEARGQGVCSARNLEFTRISATLYAIAIGTDATMPWTAAERAEVTKLRQRWEALGGDSADVSESYPGGLGACPAAPGV